ncbi:MAG TPA: outer membrane beta-barrel protein [Chitinophagaceae bacterium]|nr:porin [Chitinophagaceae bacterium]HPG11498.1 outer membrane beta-barrel protein [Chitinophagaceae bacterium]
MVRKFLATAIIGFSVFSSSFAQDSTSASSLSISGYVDAYYRYNFQNAKDVPAINNYTSFTNSHNSFELGMASVKFDYSKGKIGGVLDLGLGNRAQEFSYTDVTTSIDANFDEVMSPTLLAAVKQAYLTYSPVEDLTFSMGKWGTHVGYELLDPQLNSNYSMSYMFSYGPFSHTGIKVDYAVGDGFGIMAGVTNPTDVVSASFAKKNVIAQVSKTGDDYGIYLNYVGGKDLGNFTINQFGLTASATLSDKVGIGYDGTVKSVKPPAGISESWWGSALYLNVDPCSKFRVSLRGEYFSDKKGVAGFGTSLVDATLSFNYKPFDGLVIIPEFRYDAASDPIFYKNSDINPTAKSTGSFILGAVISF